MITYSLTENADSSYITIAGRILEDIEPQVGELEKIPGTNFELDLAGITGANSVGTRLWYRLMTSLSKKGQIILHNCSVFFVDYANMTPQLVRNAKFASLFVPLQCTSCPHEEAVLISAPDFGSPDITTGNCPGCNSPLALQTPLEDYLRLARKSPQMRD